jgi:hypothetical protein
MTWYELFLWLHVTAAVVWVGGGLMMQLLGMRAAASGSREHMAGYSGDAEYIGMRLFTAASLLLIVSAVGLMLNDASPWDWGEPFVLVGLAVWVVSFVVGFFYLGPTAGKIKRAIEAGGPDSPEAQRLIGRVIGYQRIELVLLYFVVFMMVVKLGT